MSSSSISPRQLSGEGTLVSVALRPIIAYAVTRLAREHGFCPHSRLLAGSLTALRQMLQTLSGTPVVVAMDYAEMDCTDDQLVILHLRFPSVRFIMISHELSAPLMRRILHNTDSAFSLLLTDSPLTDYIECFRRVKEGETYVCPALQAVLDENSKEEDQQPSPLTSTEQEILRLIALGLSTRQIAGKRHLSIYTVMTHRRNIFRKIRVNNVREAVRYALRTGIADPLEYYI